MNTLIEILKPGFLLRDALVASLLVGLVCPLVGVYFVLRRMVFLGVALPQISSAGIAGSFLAYSWLAGEHQHMEGGERTLALAGSVVFTLVATLLLAAFERRGRGTVEARIGTTYAIAGAVTILFLAKDPHGDAEIVGLLKGDILATTGAGLAGMFWIFGAVAVALLAFQKELLLVSFDRDLAVVFGKRAALWDLALYVLIGIVISLGVMTAGPMATFGFLVIPPVAMRLVARRMMTFSLGSALLGAASAFAGFYLAYRFDMPLGPAEIAVASVALAAIGGVTALRRGLGAARAP